MLEVEVLRQVCQGHFHRRFCERLTEANAFATTKWYEYIMVPFLSRWSQIQGVLTVKSIRQELLGALPLCSKLLHTLVVDDQLIICLDIVVSNLTVLYEHHRHAVISGILESQCLQHHFVHVL